MSRPDGLPHLIEVRVDPTIHTREPHSEAEALTWAVLDTAWNLLREFSVRVTLAEIREQNPGFPDDETLFADARMRGGYLELAPQNESAAFGLATVFEILSDQAMHDAAEGLGFTVREA